MAVDVPTQPGACLAGAFAYTYNTRTTWGARPHRRSRS